MTQLHTKIERHLKLFYGSPPTAFLPNTERHHVQPNKLGWSRDESCTVENGHMHLLPYSHMDSKIGFYSTNPVLHIVTLMLSRWLTSTSEASREY